MEQVQEFKEGDAILYIEKEEAHPFWLIKQMLKSDDGTTWVSLLNLHVDANPFITSFPLIWINKNYIKVNESTIKILFGANYGKSREEIQKLKSGGDSIRNQTKQ